MNSVIPWFLPLIHQVASSRLIFLLPRWCAVLLVMGHEPCDLDLPAADPSVLPAFH